MKSKAHSFFFIRIDKKFVRINYCDLIYIESVSNYARLVTDKEAYLTIITIKGLDSLLPPDQFCRINRGNIVSIDHVVSFDRSGVTLKNNLRLPFSDKYRHLLESKVQIISHIGNKGTLEVTL